ncbi:MAG: hypothetical protein EOP48_25850 [Sphingobacteriales bacterium]|nr:MAG: hypothetical protein EOP48_25850 [Sphingobacteriales bacterium]
MRKFRIRIIDVMYWIALIVADIFVYVFLGMLLMSYDDNYDASKGEYFSWTSMNTFDRYAYIALNLWHAVNIIAVVYFGYKIYRQLTMRTTQASQNTGGSASVEQNNSI